LNAVYCLEENPIGKSVIEVAFGFSPSVCVLFRLEKFEDSEVGVITVLRVTIELFRHLSGDAVLLFNGEHVLLLRIRGRLFLNTGRGFWSPSRLHEVTLPYEEKGIPSL